MMPRKKDCVPVRRLKGENANIQKRLILACFACPRCKQRVNISYANIFKDIQRSEEER